jgi:NAD(P)-dependent dehydrogenase (short-subunit alcohol dehydrogenase family)
MKPPIIVVTGANRGIGLEICRQLAARGAQVVLTARDTAAGRAAVASLAATGAVVRFYSLEVTDELEVAGLRDFLAGTCGGCDVLINNAGMIAPGDEAILTVPPAAVEKTFATNTLAPLRLVQALAPLLQASARGGRVINISSGAGAVGDFDGSWAPAYAVSKAALNLVTRLLAPALAQTGVAVNAMCPGWVRTEMGGHAAPRPVAEGADTAVWLALDAPRELSGRFLRDRQVIPW